MKLIKAFFTVLSVFALIIAVYVIFEDPIRKAIYPIEYEDIVARYAEEYGVPAEKLHAVIKTESGYDAAALSPAGARGLMQLMPGTAEDIVGRLGEEYDGEKLYEPEANIRYGAYYLSYLYRIYGNWDTVYAAYNAGLGNVNGWLDDPRYTSDGESLNNIPFEETAAYVKRVRKYEEIYKELYFEDEKVSGEAEA